MVELSVSMITCGGLHNIVPSNMVATKSKIVYFKSAVCFLFIKVCKLNNKIYQFFKFSLPKCLFLTENVNKSRNYCADCPVGRQSDAEQWIYRHDSPTISGRHWTRYCYFTHCTSFKSVT